MATEVQITTQHIVPSRDRVEPGSVNIPVGQPPTTSSTPPASVDEVATTVVDNLNKALQAKDHQGIAQLFLENSYWRDHLALSWDLHTLKGRDRISSFLSSEGIRLTKLEIDRSSPLRAPHFGPIDGGIGEAKGVEFFVTFITEVGKGQGVARLAEKDGQWKIFTLFTSLRELTGREERLNHRRPKGVEHGGRPDRKNWQERRTAEANLEGKDPTVLIIGMASCEKMLRSRLMDDLRCRPGWSHCRRPPQNARRGHAGGRS